MDEGHPSGALSSAFRELVRANPRKKYVPITIAQTQPINPSPYIIINARSINLALQNRMTDLLALKSTL